MLFQYAHLLKGSIRLVRFHPDTTPSSISLTLEHESRYSDRNVHYTALAYEPQEPGGEMSEVLLQGRSRRVPRTLWQALSALVEHHDTGGRFWIDYVCVNQNNEAEKMDHQARLSSIHASADQVLLWLGYENAVTGARQDNEARGSGEHPSGNEMAVSSTKPLAISDTTLERLQLQQARKIVLIQGNALTEVRKGDPHSAL